MPRYIDAEALTAEFKRLTLGENSLIEKIFADGVYAVIETFPTADVVPRSEVEKQIAKLLISETTELQIPMKIAIRVRTEHPIYKAIEQEVAREIFEEIEKSIMSPDRSQNYKEWYFAELKKKYIGE